jgi:glutathione S-transferase
MLEEKRIPYRMKKVNMRCYGDKPPDFLAKVPSGLLPVIELDGRIVTESADIMMLLDKVGSPS